MEILKSPADQYLLLVLQQWRRLASQRPVSSNRRQIEALVNDAENQESVLGFREEGVVVVMDTLDKASRPRTLRPLLRLIVYFPIRPEDSQVWPSFTCGRVACSQSAETC